MVDVTAIDGLVIYHGFLTGYRHVADYREYMNRINVFPVADGDTGNNIVRTLRFVAAGLRPSRSAHHVLLNIGGLSLKGARGNSGSILSQFFNGVALSCAEREQLLPAEFGESVRGAVDYAYQAIDNPTEGTILTVLRSWAETVYTESQTGGPMIDILASGLKAAQVSLDQTTEQLEILKKANVPDAGALGFVRFLEGLSEFYRQGPVPLSFRRKLAAGEVPSHREECPSEHPQDFGIPKFRYCTELYLNGVRTASDVIRRQLRDCGDSLIVSTGVESARIHIHTDEPAEVVRRSRSYGQIGEQKVDDMVRQSADQKVPAGRIAVLTDSIADIPRQVLDEYNIHVLNLNFTWGDEEYLDRLTITPKEFYRQQQIRRDFPGSAAPDSERVQELYRELLEHYAGIIVLPVARVLSGTWNVMNKSAETFNAEGSRIRVIDTRLNSAAQGLLAVEIARKAADGLSLEELADYAESLKKRIRIYVSVSTFKFMVRGGRLSPLKGFLARMLRVKPIVTLDDEGRGKAFDKAFSSNGLLKKIGDIVQGIHDGPGIDRYIVVHADALDRARHFANLVLEKTELEPDYICAISPIVGMHAGKGAIAIGIIEKEA